MWRAVGESEYRQIFYNRFALKENLKIKLARRRCRIK